MLSILSGAFGHSPLELLLSFHRRNCGQTSTFLGDVQHHMLSHARPPSERPLDCDKLLLDFIVLCLLASGGTTPKPFFVIW